MSGPADIDRAAQALQHALGHLLLAQVHLGTDGEVPDAADALDQALGRNQKAQEARQAVLQALEALRDAKRTEARQRAFHAAEEAVNAVVAVALDEGFRVGWTTAGGR